MTSHLRVFVIVIIALAAASVKASDAPLLPPNWKDMAVQIVRPDYPKQSRRLHETGSAVFLLTIDPKTGKVVAVNVEKSTNHKRLDWACIKALMQWRFKPNTVHKVKMPIAFTMTL